MPSITAHCHTSIAHQSQAEVAHNKPEHMHWRWAVFCPVKVGLVITHSQWICVFLVTAGVDWSCTVQLAPGGGNKSPTDVFSEAARGTKESATRLQNKGGLPGSVADSEEASNSLGLPSSNTGWAFCDRHHHMGDAVAAGGVPISVPTSESQCGCMLDLCC